MINITSSFEAFEAEAHSAGFDEALIREWAPNKALDTHAHPFDADVLVTRGEMWLTCDGSTRRLIPGDTFTLERGKPHAKRYGAEGATYWVARRHPR